MSKVKVDLQQVITDGAEIKFYAPCGSANVTALSVTYTNADTQITETKEFTLKDAHGNNLASKADLFVEGALVKVVLSLSDASAYVQNADTNSYLEGKFTNLSKEAKDYADALVAELVDGAPETMDTLKEVAQALKDNADVVEALNTAVGNKAEKTDLNAHTSSTSNPHSVTKSQVGLGNVPNVATNDQTPTYSVATSNAELSSGEKLSVAMGKIAKAVKSLIAHIGSTSIHVDTTEKETWNAKASTAVATTSANGLMSSSDKSKLNGIATGANKYVLPTASSTLGGVKTTSTVTSADGLTPCPIIDGVPYYTNNSTYNHPTTSGYKHIPSGGASGQILRWSADGTAVWGNDNNTQYNNATTSDAGLMSASDKTKLNGIETGANKYTHPASGVTAGTYRSVTVDAQGHVTGGTNPTVTVAQGGTGATTAKGAEYNLIGAISESTNAISDSDLIVQKYSSPSATQGVLLYKKASALWTYISGKLSGAISTILTTNLTASRALISNGSGKVVVSSVTSTELGYLDGVTSNIQTQIDAVKKSASDGKSSIASAITNQGVTTATDATYAVMATNIGTVATNKYSAGQTAGYNSGYSAGQTAGASSANTSAKNTLIPYFTSYGVNATTSWTFDNFGVALDEVHDNAYDEGYADAMVGTAVVSNVLSGKTFTNSSGVGLTGTMTNNGAKTASLNCGGSYTIPAGYHNGSGKVTANSLSSQTSATATSSQILSGKTAWVNGSKVTGTMTDYSSNKQSFSTSAAGVCGFDLPDGYHTMVYVDTSGVYNAGISAGAPIVKELTGSLSFNGTTATFAPFCDSFMIGNVTFKSKWVVFIKAHGGEGSTYGVFSDNFDVSTNEMRHYGRNGNMLICLDGPPTCLDDFLVHFNNSYYDGGELYVTVVTWGDDPTEES